MANRALTWFRPSGRRFTRACRSRRKWARWPCSQLAASSRPIKGKPINALYTSTCGGRTENSENIFEYAEPYLRGVECSLEGHRHFEPFLIKTIRQPAKLRDEENLELVRLMSLLASNGFYLSTPQMTDEWFDEVPNESEMSNWLNQIAGKFGKPFPNVNQGNGKAGRARPHSRVFDLSHRVTRTRC